jgi:Tfp pilus assembly protein PilX
MIIAWVLSLIVIIATAIGHLEQSTALHIRLLAIEQGAHAAFMAAEKKLNQCESQLQAITASPVITAHDSNTDCELILVDANKIGELIRIRAAGSAKQTYSTLHNRIQTQQTQMESLVYRNKQDQTLERLSWRVLWSGAQSDQRSPH